MLIRKYTPFLIIFAYFITKSKSEIADCLFVNTINVTTSSTNYTEIENVSEMVGIYDYEILSNGTKVSVAPHKRLCICPDPCLSVCVENPFEEYEEIIQKQKKIVISSNGSKEQDLSEFFNHRLYVPCNEPYLYPLVSELNPNDKWSLFENGTVLLHKSKNYRNQLQYCFKWHDIFEDDDYCGSLFVPHLCSDPNNHFVRDQIKSWAMVGSIPFFLMTILFYCFLPQIKNCHGKCFVMYLIHLTVTYALISYARLYPGDFQELQCSAIGFAIYFSTIAFLTWISVISYDTYIVLTGFSNSILFRRYFWVGLCVPFLLTLMVSVMQEAKIEDELKPGIEPGNCAVISNRWSAIFYYYIPHIAVLIFGLIMYIKLIRFMQKHERDVTTYAGKIRTTYRQRFSIYFRLFIFMGVIWFLEILSYFISMMQGDSILVLVLDLFNGLHGLFIFLSVVCSSNVWRDVMKRFTKNGSAEHELITTTSMDGENELLSLK